MNLADTVQIFGGGPGSGCNGPNCGRPVGSGKETKADAITRIMKERGLSPSFRTTAERIYHEQKFGNLKTLQRLAKGSGTEWQATSAHGTEAGRSVLYTKDLGHGKGQLSILVSQTHNWREGLVRPTVDVSVKHKMSPSAKTWTQPEHRTFVWEIGMKQAQQYLQRQYGIKDFSNLKGIK